MRAPLIPGGLHRTGGLYKNFHYGRILNKVKPENLAVAIGYIFNALLFFNSKSGVLERFDISWVPFKMILRIAGYIESVLQSKWNIRRLR